MSLPYFSRKGEPLHNSLLLRSNESCTVYPKDDISLELPQSVQSSYLAISPRVPFTSFEPKLQHFHDEIRMINASDSYVVGVTKGSHLFDVLACYQMDMKQAESEVGKIRRLYDIADDDVSHLCPSSNYTKEEKSYLSDIDIDPDGIMPAEWKEKFRLLCEEYSAIITPVPGKYNGAYGHVSTAINFSSPPRCYLTFP